MASLENVKVGDRVIRASCHNDGSVCVVTKVTKLHIFIDNSLSKYSKRNGLMVGRSRWSRVTISSPGPGEIDEIEARKAACDARCFVEDHIDAIKKTPAAFIPIAKFIKENLKCSDATS